MSCTEPCFAHASSSTVAALYRGQKKQKQIPKLWVFSSLREGFYKIKTTPVALFFSPRDCLHWPFLCQIISKCPFLLFVWDTATSTCLQMSLYVCFFFFFFNFAFNFFPQRKTFGGSVPAQQLFTSSGFYTSRANGKICENGYFFFPRSDL